jgi:hypothetical protein
MFDLEQAIAEWRRQMRAAGITAAELDELESHLRDAIARQMGAGSSVKVAFEFAAREIGPAGALGAEFQTARTPYLARFWKWIRVGYVAEIVVYTLLQTRQLLRSAPSDGELRLGMVGLTTTLLLAYAGWHLATVLADKIPSKRTRSLLGTSAGFSAVLWMIIFAQWIVPSFDYTTGGFAVVLLWGLAPVVILPTLLVGMEGGKVNLAK